MRLNGLIRKVLLAQPSHFSCGYIILIHHICRDHPSIDFRSRQDQAPKPVDLYDEEIRYTDEQIERFFEVFELSKFSKNTYVMIHSDHGEGFGEHGYQYHGQNLFNDQVHVPLILFGPQLPSQSVRTPVSLIDVMPTVPELAQVSALPPEPRVTHFKCLSINS